MQDVLDRAAARRASLACGCCNRPTTRRSLSLYARMGFQVRDVVACMQGPPIGAAIPGYHVRPATEADRGRRAIAVCRHVHGHDRGGELRDAIAQGSAVVVVRTRSDE